MKKEAVLHTPMSNYAHAVSPERLVIRLRAAKGDLTRVTLHYGDRACRQNPVVFTQIDMEAIYSDLLFDWWEVEFETLYLRMCYYFTLTDGKESILYYADLFTDALTSERSEFFQFPFLHREGIADAPEWAKDAVIYNIFPDSFATDGRFISKLPTSADWNGETVFGKHGGTILGIAANADYLSELGVNCVYINPLFAAGAYHKYDLIDYYNVDPCFGTNADFARMVDALHEKGIRVVIDGVFNHCGWRFFAFDDVMRNGKASRYAKWFYRLTHPVVYPENGDDIPGYECFAYERLMPKLDTAQKEVEEYFCGVARHWLQEYKVDGWRLDVADEAADSFWRAFRRAALEAKPDAFLIGEVWSTASHWLDGSMFHSTMNYDMRRHCRAFFARGTIDAGQFAARVTNMLTRYRKNLTYAQLNILDSHDVSRFLTLCGGDKRRLKLAVLFQMCFVGIPSVFYGDGQGFSGLTEEEYRRPMRWDMDQELFAFYKQAIRLRRNTVFLRRGEYKTVLAEGQLYAFWRGIGKEGMTIVLNAGDTPAQYGGVHIEPFGYMTL